MTESIFASGWYGRWQALNDWLLSLQDYWRPVPFTTPEPPWCQHQPALRTWLADQDDCDVDRWERDSSALAQALMHIWPAQAERAALLALPTLAGEPATLTEADARDMPGRKRLQAGAFTSSLLPAAGAVVDWCCGKGHLGQTLAAAGCQVTGLEWDPALVRDGNALAERSGAKLRIRQQDVMAAEVALPGDSHGVALHACGELHRQLLRRGSEARLRRLSLSPCCYHLGLANDHYRPLSRRVADSDRVLSLGIGDLRLVVQETVTAPAREQRLRDRTSAWRLGFDGLQRHLRGCDEYLPVPSHPTRLNQGDFAGFCRWAAARKGLTLSGSEDFDYWLDHGHQRLQQVRRFELVRHLFRRPLELWLLMDYALYLEEHGYRVRLGTFCARRLTPRNLLLDAVTATPG